MPDRSDDCAGAAVLCGLTSMNGYTCQNADYVNMQGPPSLCPGWGAPTNIGWWAFVTSGGNVCITVTYMNCTFPPPGGTNGIQIGIYEDCTFSNLIICDATCPGATGTKVICGNLIACKPYYLFVDGCNGDVCDFTLATSGGAAPKLDPIGKINNVSSQKIDVCKGACKKLFEVKAQKAGCESMYIWELDGMDLGVNSNKIELDFENEGTFVLCATAIIGTSSSICDKIGPECATITVKKLDDKKSGPRYICPEKIPYSWLGETITMSGIVRKELRDANCCYFDSVVEFVILPVPNPPNFYYIGCGPLDVFKDPITGRIYNSCESQTLVQLPTSTVPFKCDSTYYLNAIFLKFIVSFTEKCSDQEIEITPRIINQTSSCGGGETFSFSYRWYLQSDASKKTISNDEKALVMKKGDYCLELNVETKLGDLTKTCKLEYCETLDEDNLKLTPICIIGDTINCKNSKVRYSVDSIFFSKIISNTWVVNNGIILTPNPNDSTSIEVLWSNNIGKGKICYTYINECGTSPECCLNINIIGAPTPSAGPDKSICGLTTNLDGKKDIGGEWILLNGPGNATIQNLNNDTSSITVDQYGKYTLIWQEKIATCIGSDTVQITFGDIPLKETDVIICNSNNSAYKIKFKINNGTAPYNVLKGNGTIDATSTYISNDINNNTKDTIIIMDANGCQLQYIHEYECKCNNQIGSFDVTETHACGNEIINVIYDSTGQILGTNPNDTLIFFIYTDPNDPLGSRIQNLNSLSFSYQIKLNFFQKYYIGAYLGKKDNNGGIDINSSCVRITKAGQPFIFYPKPSPNAGRDTSICGNTIELNGHTSISSFGNLLWNSIGNGTFNFSNKNDSNCTITLLNNYGTYTFELTESSNLNCEAKDLVNITFNSIPEISNIDKICVDLISPGRYIVKADIKNGNPPYSLISTGGKLINNQWCSDTITSLTAFNIKIKDINGCQSIAISDNYNCNCGIINSGSLDTAITYLCEDQCISIKSIISEQIDPIEDVVMYILHKGFYKNALDTFYSINDKICFNPVTMNFGINNIYFISRIVGDDKNPKDGNVDFNDPCLRVSNNQPIVWFSKPKPVITGPQSLNCKTPILSLDGSSSSVGSPTLAIYKWSTSNGNIAPSSNVNSNKINIDKAGIYELEITDSLTKCISKISYTITTDINKPIVDIAIPAILNCDILMISLDGSNSTTGNSITSKWNGPGILGTNSGYQITVNQKGNYTLHLIDNNNGCEDSLSVLVLEDITPPTSNIQQIGKLLCNTTQVSLSGINSKGSSGKIKSYTWTSLQGNIFTGQDSSQITISKPGGIFILSVKDDINGCIDLDTIIVQEEANPLKKIEVNAKDPNCFGDVDGQIEIEKVIDTLNQEVLNIEYSINGGTFSKQKTFNNQAKGQYTITARDANGCLIKRIITLTEPQMMSISVVKEKLVNQGDIVNLDSMLIALFGGTTLNGQYKDTLWFNTDDQIDWESFLQYKADKNRSFTITGIDQSDCEITGQVRIIVRVIRDIWWPSAFSPNGDGQNDYFNLFGKNVRNIKSLFIYDRWGNLVYSGQSLQVANSASSTQGWDGTFKGQNALPGVYTFQAEVEFEDSKYAKLAAGEVSLIR